MAYFNPNEKLETKEEAYDYIVEHGIMTDATFSNLNDDDYTDERMKPIYDYLKDKGLKIQNGGFFDEKHGFGGIYFMYDENVFPTPSEAKKEVNEILKKWDSYNN